MSKVSIHDLRLAAQREIEIPTTLARRIAQGKSLPLDEESDELHQAVMERLTETQPKYAHLAREYQ